MKDDKCIFVSKFNEQVSFYEIQVIFDGSVSYIAQKTE